jgi:hypothetical protein
MKRSEARERRPKDWKINSLALEAMVDPMATVAPMVVEVILAVMTVAAMIVVVMRATVAEGVGDEEKAILVEEMVQVFPPIILLLTVLDRYRDGDSRDSRRASESASYGGSYETSGARGRYSDEPRDTQQNDQTEEPFKTTSTKKTTSTSSGGGKFKVNIKSDSAAPSRASASTSSSQAQPQVDFFGSSGGQAATFDAFGLLSTQLFPWFILGTEQSHDGFDAFQSAPAAPVRATHGGFDAFSTPAQPAHQTFDAFSTPVAPQTHNQFDAFQTPAQTFQPQQQQQSFGNFQSPPQQFDPFSGGAPTSFAPPPQPLPQQQNYFPTAAAHDDFGDFEGASAPAPASKPVDKWGSLGGLVNLTDLNAPTKKESAPLNQSSGNHSSFAGLDGFSQPRQTLVTRWWDISFSSDLVELWSYALLWNGLRAQ